jgi:two-component system, chemotaxis family, protein-glutamate methylesterase/glutaminase
MAQKIGVLVVDDSPLIRQLIIDALVSDPDIEILGTASNGLEAIDQVAKLKPQVITMDVDMPVMNGLDATERIMAEMPTPILVLTADPRREAPALTHRALAAGALALQVKPALDTKNEAWRLASEVKLLASVKVIRHLKGAKKTTPSAITPMALPKVGAAAVATVCPFGVVALVGSTGGPQVLHKLISDLPGDFPAPILIVQHINAAFADSLVTWLQSVAKLRVKMAEHGEPLIPGSVYLAPPEKHLVVPSRGRISLESGAPRDGHIPSGSAMLESIAKVYLKRSLGLILTGMGADGAEGLLAMRNVGATTLIQNQDTCVVYGMPGAAHKKGAAEFAVAGDEIAHALVRLSRSEPFSGLHRL